MRLLCLSLALAIIYIMAIVRAPRVEARAAKSKKDISSSSEESSSSGISYLDWNIPAKPATPEQTVEAFALGIPTILGGLYWTEKAYDTMHNNSMLIANKIKNYPTVAEAVQAYINKSLTW